MKNVRVLRRISQFFFFSIFVIWTKLFFAFDPLIAVGVSIADRVFLKILIPSALLILATVVLGRFFCGWICPLGSMIDFAGLIRNKFTKKELSCVWMRYFKFIILGILIVFAILGIQVVWWLDPVTIASRFIGILIGMVQSKYFSNTLWISGIWFCAIFLTVLSRRFWCRNICPLGAFLALAVKISPFKRKKFQICAGCEKCVINCRMSAIKYNKEECILCMDCVYDCPVMATHE